MAKKKAIKKDEPVKLDMTFQEAMQRALNTPLPKKKAKKKALNTPLPKKIVKKKAK